MSYVIKVEIYYQTPTQFKTRVNEGYLQAGSDGLPQKLWGSITSACIFKSIEDAVKHKPEDSVSRRGFIYEYKITLR